MGTQNEGPSYFYAVPLLLKRNIGSFQPEMMLDIGCGNGVKTVHIARQLHIALKNVHGVDIDDKALAACREVFSAERVDLEKERLPYADDAFDLVICNQVLEHLKHYVTVIHESIRVTRKGGYLFIGIPNLSHLANRLLLLFGIQPMCMALDGPHVRGFTHKAFLRLLQSFEHTEVIDQMGTVMYPLPFFAARFMTRHFVGLSGYTFYLLRKSNA
ncbi:MAG TPA: class I SAM-dependent methyltransferase [Syntrophales bacterium]|nr:class I SAM-dependent methyltransferase [Syntrophales bacterium]